MDLDKLAASLGLTRQEGESDEALKARIEKAQATRYAEDVRELPELDIRAEFLPDSINEENRTASFIASTGARGLRRPIFDAGYYEELGISEDTIRLERFNNGAPFLLNHDHHSVESQVGVITGARVEDGNLVADVRFSKREGVNDIFNDVKDGILRNVSVGYRIHELTEVGKDEGIPILRATDWEPMELSLVTIPFDGGAQARDTEKHAVIVRSVTPRAPEPINPPAREVPTMDLDKRAAELGLTRGEGESDEALKSRIAIKEAELKAADDAKAAAEKAAGEATEAERKRVADINEACGKAGIEERDFIDSLVADGKSVEAARAAILDHLAKRSEGAEISGQARVVVGDNTALRTAVSGALLHRADPDKHKLEGDAGNFAGMSLLRIAEEVARINGIDVRGLAPLALAERALGTSDLPNIVADVANKSLRAGYDGAPRTFLDVFRRAEARDFKNINRVQLSGAPDLKEVNESGEFESGEMSDGKETYKLLTYGRIVPVTRQVIVNDDLDAFSRVPSLMGRAAADKESDIVWGLVNANDNLADGIPLFDAQHNNVGTGGAIDVATVGELRQQMRKQVGLEGRLISVQPVWMIVPAERETEAEKFLGDITPRQIDDVRPDSMARLRLVVEPRLNAAPWYMAADYNQVDTIEYAYLSGENGPFVESRTGFRVDGVEIKVRHDFAAKAIDFRGLQQNPGA